MNEATRKFHTTWTIFGETYDARYPLIEEDKYYAAISVPYGEYGYGFVLHRKDGEWVEIGNESPDSCEYIYQENFDDLMDAWKYAESVAADADIGV